MKVRLEPDQIDLEHLRTTADSPGFALIEEKQLQFRRDVLKQLEAAESWEGYKYLQGQLHAIDRVLELPKILHNEIRVRLKRCKD